MPAIAITTKPREVTEDFRTYLEKSLRDPFTINLRDRTLMETARRTAITVNVLRGHNIHGVKKCSGHSDLRIFDNYIRDDN